LTELWREKLSGDAAGWCPQLRKKGRKMDPLGGGEIPAVSQEGGERVCMDDVIKRGREKKVPMGKRNRLLKKKKAS